MRKPISKKTQSKRYLNEASVFDASQETRGLPTTIDLLKSSDELTPPRDWRSLVSLSRHLESNNGIVRGAIDIKSTYSIGNAIIPRPNVATSESLFARDWVKKWMKRCNIAGKNYNWQTSLFLISKSIDIDGDCFVLLTFDNFNDPKIQILPADRILNPQISLSSYNDVYIFDSGKYKGMEMISGIIKNDMGETIAYCVDGDLNNIVTASSIIHCFDPEKPCQRRGYPIFSHAINAFRFIDQIHENELNAFRIQSQIALIEKNETGLSPRPMSMKNEVDLPPRIKDIGNGQILYIKAGTGSDLSMLDGSNRPSANYQSFEERITESALAGIGIPLSIVTRPSNNGTANRVELAKIDKTCQDRQALICEIAETILLYALSKAIENGEVFHYEGWTNWIFSTPPRASIDLGRDTTNRIKEYDAGIINLSDIKQEEGIYLQDHIAERINEQVLIEKAIQDAEIKHGISIDRNQIRKI